MSTPLGMSALAGRIASARARGHADRALRISTEVWGSSDHAELGRHAVAADDAAFLAEAAAQEGRHEEAREHACHAREEYQLVAQLAEGRHARYGDTA